MTQPQSLSDDDRENLVAYLDGELDKKSARALESKLGLDPNARKEADTLRRTWELLDYLPRAEPSANFTHRTIEKMAVQQGAAGPGRLSWGVRLGWVAALIVAGVLGYSAVGWKQHRLQNELEQRLAHDLHVIENISVYEHVDDIDFLNKLANPNDTDLFGEENLDS